MDLMMIVVLAIVLIIIVTIVAMIVIKTDLMSYTAKGSKTLSPAGEITGNVLVVYNPGLSGAAKNASADITEELKSRGYEVTLRGLKNRDGNNTSGYDIIIAGGPMYFGKATGSIETYLKELTVPKDAKLGVFTTTGSSEFNNEDIESLAKQVESLQGDLPNKTVTKTIRSGDKAHTDCMDFVSALLK